MSVTHKDLYGYYDDPSQSHPAYCPRPWRCACCFKEISDEPCDKTPQKWISVMSDDAKSWFFVVHPECWERCDDGEKRDIEVMAFGGLAA